MTEDDTRPRPSAGVVRQLRLVVAAEDYAAAVEFYREVLGLPEQEAIAGPDGAHVTILDAGRATLELANPQQRRFIDRVEVGREDVAPRLRVAFEVADARAATAALVDAGAVEVAPPTVTPWQSLNARLDAPAGLQITLFQELAATDAGRPEGAPEPESPAAGAAGSEAPGRDAAVGAAGMELPAGGDAPVGRIGAGEPLGPVTVRAATPDDWPAIWPFLREIVAAGETYCWPRDTSEEEARTRWMHEPPGRTVVAVDAAGTVLGTAETHPNQAGGGASVANAGFMVDPAHAGRGVGRLLAEHVLDRARADGYRAMQFNAVVETNGEAVALWRSLGFAILATIPEAFDHPVHGPVGLHVMHRPL